MHRLCAILLSLSALGCSLDLGDVPFYCNKGGNPECPDGYKCMQGTGETHYCVKKGSCPDYVPECSGSSTCGNKVCDSGETTESCPSDCPAQTCGDGTCGLGETATGCPADCHISTCGNKTCDAGEDTSTCPTDCKAVCGNKTCEVGENGSSCPADCGGSGCGNGTCDSGETATSCPADCSSCKSGETKCEASTSNLSECVNGVWQTQTCEAICKKDGYDYAAGCEYSSTYKKYVCKCNKGGAFGAPCDSKALCATGLICGFFDASKGFCTKYCTTPDAVCSGAPSGTTASCILEFSGGKYACGFDCSSYSAKCPTGLTCDSSDDLCKP